MPEIVRPLGESGASKTHDNLSRVNERLRSWDYTLTHATELLVEKPVSYTVTGGLALRSYDTTTGSEGLPVQALTVREVNPTTLGITAYFAAPPGAVRLRKSADQVGIASGAATTVTWDVDAISPFGAISHSNTVNTTRITCSTAGLVRVSYVLHWTTLPAFAGNNRIGGFVRKNGVEVAAGSRWALIRQQSTGISDQSCATDLVNVSAGDYLEVRALQTNTTAAAVDLGGNSANECSVAAEYVSPPSTASYRVSLLFLG